MRTLSATEASRSFAALLDRVERGETVLVTRGGRRIATIAPAATGNGAALLALVERCQVDSEFASDVLAARDAAAVEELEWPAD